MHGGAWDMLGLPHLVSCWVNTNLLLSNQDWVETGTVVRRM